MNVGYLSTQRPGLVPCTPAGVMEILKRSQIPVAGQEAVVVGRSDIVGKPVAMLLLNQNATVTVCHSKTHDLPGVCRRADILVAAIGRAGMVTRDYVKPGATVIDVGINRVTDRKEFDQLFAGNKKREETFVTKGSTLVGRSASRGGGSCRGDYSSSGRSRPAYDRHADGQHGEGGDAEKTTMNCRLKISDCRSKSLCFDRRCWQRGLVLLQSAILPLQLGSAATPC